MKTVFYATVIIVLLDENIASKIRGITSNKLNKSPLRVLEGFDDLKNEYPFVVSLGGSARNKYKHRHQCSGSLIADQWVLTAAHCVAHKKPETMPTTIRYGNMTLHPNDTSAKYSRIRKYIPHSFYEKYEIFDDEIFRNDIALLLVEKVQIEFYGRISAVDYMTLMGLPVKYVGMGNIEYEPEITKDYRLKTNTMHRQIGESVVVKCEKEILSKYNLCIRPKCSRKGQTPRPGDSGGPLLQAGHIVGVCSWQHEEAQYHEDIPFFFNYYTALSPYLDWISEVTTSRADKE